MKLTHVVFLNVATVTAALLVYDLWRDPTPRAGREPVARSVVADTASLERRLQAAEEERARLVERLAALEGTDHAPAAAPDRVPDEAPVARPDPESAAPAMDRPPTKEEVRRFRRLRDAVRGEDAIEKNRVWVDRALGKLSINLTPQQREQVHAAYAAFQPQVDRIWGEVKKQAGDTIAAGGTIDRGALVATTQQRIQTEFAASLAAVFGHPAHAEAVAEALLPGRKG